jgi:hypothetical protein
VVAAAFVIGLGVFGAGAALADDQADIVDTFAAARAALLNRDSGTVTGLLSRGTLDRAERIRAGAAAGDGAGLGRIGPSEKFAVLGLRQNLKPADIQKRDIPGLIDYALHKPWLGADVLRQAELTNVSVKGDRATGTVMVNGRPVMVPASFVREGGRWHVDLVPALDMSDALLRMNAAMQNKSEDTVVAEVLQHATRLQQKTPAKAVSGAARVQ